MRPGWLHKLVRPVGLDFHVLTTLASRAWSVVAGAVTVLLIPHFLSPTEQGYYYTFSSLLALQILFELGLGHAVVQIVGHEAADLVSTPDGRLEGPDSCIDRLASFATFLRRWYFVAALLFALVAGLLGGMFLAEKGELPRAEWLLVWVAMVVATSINLTYIPAIAFQEGLGRVGDVSRLRMIQSMIGYAGLWLALVMGASLWAASLVPLASMIITGIWIRRAGRTHLWLSVRNARESNAIRWRQEVLPFQWRIALSAGSGFFIFYAVTPLVFARQGAVEAGRFGLALTIFNAIASVGTSWVYARTPRFAMHIARGERRELNALFRDALIRSVCFTSLCAICVVLLVAALKGIGVPQLARISDPPILLCLAVVCAANSVIFSVAAYMRAHRQEPMLGVSVVGALLVVTVAYFASGHGLLVMSVLYAAVTAVVLLPWSVILFRRYYRRV